MNNHIRDAVTHWPKVAPLLTPAKTKGDYRKLVQALDAVLDAGGADERHPLASLVACLGDLIADYESAHHPKKEMPAHEFLRELMRQRGLSQSALPEVGSQGVVSEILAGKRALNARQIAALARRFKLSADVFLA